MAKSAEPTFKINRPVKAPNYNPKPHKEKVPDKRGNKYMDKWKGGKYPIVDEDYTKKGPEPEEQKEPKKEPNKEPKKEEIQKYTEESKGPGDKERKPSESSQKNLEQQPQEIPQNESDVS